MRHTPCLALLVVLSRAAAQTPEPPTAAEVAERRAAYQQAFSAWESGDPKLEEEFLTADPDAALARIEAARNRRLALLQAKGAYLKALRLTLAADLAQLRGAGSALQPQPDDAVAASKQTLGEIAAAYQNISERLDQPNLSPAVSTALRRQREDLADAQNLYLQQQQRLEKLAADQREYQMQRTAQVENTERLMRLCGYRESLVPDEISLWNRYYEALVRYVRGGARPLSGAPGAQLPFAGSWTWIANALERAPDYANESVQLKVTEKDGTLRGTFLCYVHVPAGKSEKSVISFEFSGPRSGNVATLQWTGPKGAKGTLQLGLTAQGMAFEWKASQIGGLDFSSGSSFGRPLLQRTGE